MKNKTYMTISEFSRLTGIKRANLIFYDKIGLLSPEYRGENEYRYYTRHQLGSAYLIVTLRSLSIGLDEIRQYADGRTPERMILLFETQEKRIRQEIDRLSKMRKLMKLYIEQAHDTPAGDMEEIVIREQKQEPIFKGPAVDPNQTDDQSSLAFYEYTLKHGIGTDYPLGTVLRGQNTTNGESEVILWYYFKVPSGGNAFKPAGRYAVAYGHCPYGGSEEVHRRLRLYIEEQGLTVCADAYEEYPLNEMSIQDDSDYLVKVEIPIV